MKTKFLSLIILCISLMAWSGTAFAIPFTMTNFGDDDVSLIEVSVVDISVGQARVSVDVSTGPIVGDIGGVFFDLLQDVGTLAVPNWVPSDITGVTGVTGSLGFVADEGNVTKAPNNSNINPFKFDVGVSIGNKNLTDDIQFVQFDVFGTGLVSADFTRIGVRLQSVGKKEGLEELRTGSSKYVSAVPEPATMLLLGAGLIGLAGLGRRKFFKKT